MRLSKRARKGIGIFSRLQWSKSREKYMYHRRKQIIDLANVYAPEVLNAATVAMDKLIKNTEAHNAELSAIPNQENDAQPAQPEGSPQQSVSEQPEAGEAGPEGTPGGSL